MKFYVLTIEKINEKSVEIFGRTADNENRRSSITVNNIISPIFYIPNPGKISQLTQEIIHHYKNDDADIQKVFMHNYFYDLPNSVECVKVISNSNNNFSSPNLKSRITQFTSPIENILISRRIRGPCIIEMDNFSESTKGKFFCSLENISFVEHAPTPKLLYASVALNPINKKYSALIDNYYREGSLDMINQFLIEHDPDIIVCHNLHSKLETKGRLVADIYVIASDLIKGRTNSIEELCDHFKIGECKNNNENPKRIKIDENTKFDTKKTQLMAIISIFYKLNALELYKHVSEICGNLLSKSLKTIKSEQVDYLIMNELYLKNAFFPEKKKEYNESTYSGGLVLNPMSGFYETLVLLFDFNSLYPSIIREFNICFSTIGKENLKYEDEIKKNKDLNHEIANKLLEDAKSCEKGILPQIFELLVNRRKHVKELFQKTKDPLLDIRQKALKLTANSIYGCLGASISRFYNPTMAQLITYKGRQILKAAKSICEEKLNLEVIYGDTDSIMINTKIDGKDANFNEAKTIGIDVIKIINLQYENIEIELEKVFKKLLLYTKKKYGALVLFENGNTIIESRGLDLNRRDFCAISNRTLNYIFKLILSNNDTKNNNNPEINYKILNHAIELSKNIQTYPVEDFFIDTKLSKNPDSYSSPEIHPPVYLAYRLIKNGFNYQRNDIVTYVVGQGKLNDPLYKKVYHPSEKFLIDYQWYLEQQIFTPLQRLLSIVNGITKSQLRDIFGVKTPIRTEIIQNINFLTPCCNSLQPPDIKCRKCNTPIDDLFYINKIYDMVRKEIATLYDPEWKCDVCNKIYHGFTKVCLGCSAELSFQAKNAEFDRFIIKLSRSFKSEESDIFLNELESHNEFAQIDLSMFFPEEIENFRMNESKY
ncbi:DNA polymerase alpha catalytic subunit [Dictyocoela muelleri]|nr:DNA polymerase alpha catalytic subunit [Dictyocoela muelleri]